MSQREIDVEERKSERSNRDSLRNSEREQQQLQQQQLNEQLNRNIKLIYKIAQSKNNNELFPSRQNLPWYWRWGHTADIFNFEPVPKTSLVSTRRSQIASLVAVFLMLLYVGYTIYDFFYNNTPRLNQFSIPIDFNQVYDVQEFAFGFYEMDTSSNLIDDPTLFTYYLEQYVYSNNPNDKGHEDLSYPVEFEACTPKWAPVQIKMLCPKKQMVMQGMIGKGDYLKYPRIKILACVDNKAAGIVCDKNKAISEFPKGRLFIFIKQDEEINFATDETLPESGIFYYYFIVPTLYDRAETIIGTKQITKYPNYGSTFKEVVYNYQNVINNNLYVSDVSYFFQPPTPDDKMNNKLNNINNSNNANKIKNTISNNNMNGGTNSKIKTKIYESTQFNIKDQIQLNYSQQNSSMNDNLQPKPQLQQQLKADVSSIQPYFSWWMSISPTQTQIEVNYKTSANMISLWGGLWGVLQAAFTFIYMTYNAKLFYKKNKEWDRFDNVIKVNRLSTFDIDRNNNNDDNQINQMSSDMKEGKSSINS